MKVGQPRIREIAASAETRFQLWIELLRAVDVASVAEIGVYRGDFAAEILSACGSIKTYYMVDPWRHLDDWNKPANTDDQLFEQFLDETKEKTDFAADKRVILRGTTSEVIEEIPDGDLDFAYIDGDHTLRGIAVDLIRVYPKVRVGGWIGGDDFSRTVWEHDSRFEPTLVFPFAVHFAEAVGARIVSLPHSQFLIERTEEARFEFLDLAGRYGDTSLRSQFRPSQLIRLRGKEILVTLPGTKRLARNAKALLRRLRQ